jgi:hypothetical protein
VTITAATPPADETGKQSSATKPGNFLAYMCACVNYFIFIPHNFIANVRFA